jgi:hypothetical protein
VTPVSPTVTGPLPKLEINLAICEIGDPCRAAQPAQEESAKQPKLNARPAYVCRIHRIRRFFEELGWVAGQ